MLLQHNSCRLVLARLQSQSYPASNNQLCKQQAGGKTPRACMSGYGAHQSRIAEMCTSSKDPYSLDSSGTVSVSLHGLELLRSSH